MLPLSFSTLFASLAAAFLGLHYTGEVGAIKKCFSCLSAPSRPDGWRWEALGLSKLPPLVRDDCNHPFGVLVEEHPLATVPVVDCNSECYEILVVNWQTIWHDGYWARGCRDDIVNASRPASGNVCEKGYLLAITGRKIQHRICTSDEGKHPCNGYPTELKDEDCSTPKKTKCFECKAGERCKRKRSCEGAHCYNLTKLASDGTSLDNEYRGCSPVDIFQSNDKCYSYADQARDANNMEIIVNVCLCNGEYCNPQLSAAAKTSALRLPRLPLHCFVILCIGIMYNRDPY